MFCLNKKKKKWEETFDPPCTSYVSSLTTFTTAYGGAIVYTSRVPIVNFDFFRVVRSKLVRSIRLRLENRKSNTINRSRAIHPFLPRQPPTGTTDFSLYLFLVNCRNWYAENYITQRTEFKKVESRGFLQKSKDLRYIHSSWITLEKFEENGLRESVNSERLTCTFSSRLRIISRETQQGRERERKEAQHLGIRSSGWTRSRLAESEEESKRRMLKDRCSARVFEASQSPIFSWRSSLARKWRASTERGRTRQTSHDA